MILELLDHVIQQSTYVAGFNKIFNCKLNKIMNFKQHSEILFISSYCPCVVMYKKYFKSFYYYYVFIF